MAVPAVRVPKAASGKRLVMACTVPAVREHGAVAVVAALLRFGGCEVTPRQRLAMHECSADQSGNASDRFDGLASVLPYQATGDGFQAWIGDHFASSGAAIVHKVAGARSASTERTEHFAWCKVDGCGAVGKVDGWQCAEHGADRVIGCTIAAPFDGKSTIVRHGIHKGKRGQDVRPSPTAPVMASGRWTERKDAAKVDGGKVLVYRLSVLAMAHGPWKVDTKRSMAATVPVPVHSAERQPLWNGGYVEDSTALRLGALSKDERREMSTRFDPTTGRFAVVLCGLMAAKSTQWADNLQSGWAEISGRPQSIRRLPLDPSTAPVAPLLPYRFGVIGSTVRNAPLLPMADLRRCGYLVDVRNADGSPVKQRPTKRAMAAIVAVDARAVAILDRKIKRQATKRSTAAKIAATTRKRNKVDALASARAKVFGSL